MAQLPIVLLFFLLVAILLRMDMIFYVVYVVAGAFGLARWWVRRNLKRISVERRFTDHIFAGEGSSIEVIIRNPSLLPVPWLHFAESQPTNLADGGPLSQSMMLGPREEVTLRYELEARQRGFYRVGPGRLTTGDLFGFAEAQGQHAESRPLVVYPRVIPLLYTPLTSRSPHGTIASRQPIFTDPARVIGVRDYQPGDPVRGIDWKTSARAGQLQVKKTEPAVSMATAIYVDLHSPSYSRQLLHAASEWAIVLAASLAAYLIEQRQEVGLGSNGRDGLTGATCWTIAPRTGRDHLMKLLEWLARVEADETQPLAAWLPQAAVDLTWGTTVIAVTSSGHEAMCAALGRLRQGGLNPVLIAVEGHAQFVLIRERCHRLGVTAFEIADESALRRWQARASGLSKGARHAAR